MRRSLLALTVAALMAVPASAQLAGTYTVGGASPDYAGIPAAVADLVAQGVSGDVVFQIRPGTYTPGTALDLGPITGASASARVRFEASDPGDRPVITRGGATAADNYVVRLDGADWVTLKNLDFVAAAPAPVGRLVVLAGDASNVTIRGCSFSGHVAPGSDEGSLLWSDGLQTHENLTVDSNTFDGGWKGIEVDGVSNTGFAITDNTFSSQEEEGLDVDGDGRVEGNTITDAPTSSSSYRAIVTSGGPADAMEVVGNTIELQTGRSGIDGLGGTTLIANNLISIRVSSSVGRGIYSTGGLVAHNTVRVIGESAALLLPVGLGVDVKIRNNVLVVNGVGPAIRDETDNSILASDHNLLYTNAGALVEWESASYTTLEAWQTASGFDGASISQTTDFVEAGSGAASWDLHLDGASLTDPSLIAPPLAEVPTDADGDARDPYNPKRGADEGTPLPPLDNADAPSGFYAVAGSSPDFADPTEAVDALKTRGMKGPVTFRIRPGTFTFRESLPTSIRVGPAASDPASALLAIRGANPGNQPVLTSGADAARNWTIRLRGLDHVELRNLVLDASGAGDLGRALDLDEGLDGQGADDVTVIGSTFIGADSGVSSDERALVWSDTETHDRFSVTGSTFTDGWAGVYVTDDDAGSDMTDVDVSDSSFDGQTRYGLFLTVDADATVSGNTFSSSAATARAIHLGTVDGYSITGNQISYTGPQSDGIYLIGTSAGTGTALVANNFVRADQPLSSYSNARDARLLHNSFYASGTTGTPVSTQANPAVSIAEMTNNILESATSDPALALAEAEDLAASDGNVLHTNGAVLVESEGTTYADLEAWQAASGLDGRSRSFNVTFQNAGQGDLHLGATSDGDPRLAGLPGTGIATDFDGEARNADNPTIGADEATPLLPLAGVYDVGTPPPGFPAAAYATLQEGLDAVHYLGVSDGVTLRFHNDFGGFPVTVREYDGATADDRLVVLPYNAGETFAHSPTDAASNGAIRVEGADHVTIGYMGLDLSGGTGGHGQAVRLEGEVEDLHLELLVGIGVPDALSLEAALVGGATATTTDLLVDRGYFSGGSSGLRLSGGDAGPSTGTTVLDSDFLDQRAAGVHLTDHDGVVVEDVVIASDQANADGIVLVDGVGASIARADILLTGTSGLASYAIWLDEQSGPAGQPVTVTNSFLTGGDQAVVLNLVDGARFAHNTMRALDGSFGGVFRSAGVGGTNQQLVNNILVHEGGGAVLSVDDSGAFSEFGANDFYTTGPTFADWDGTAYADLAAFQAGTVYGDEAVSVPVTFADASTGDLHLAGASDGDTALRGAPLPDVPDDIDLEARSLVAPYLGADEAATSIDPPPVVAIVVDGDRGARYFGPPATGITVDSLAAQNLVRGVPGYYETYPVPTLWTEYDPVGGAWVPTHGAGYELPLGRAFRWEMIDQDGVGDPTISESVALPFTLTTHQAPNDQDLLLELNTDGNRFNHLANPFGQTLDISGATGWAGGAGIRSALYAYDDVDAAWELAPATIEPWEAFRFRAAGPRRNGNPRLMIIPASA